jgi:hypothetical protein
VFGAIAVANSSRWSTSTFGRMGSLGDSGLPDPKWLRDGDMILKFRES